MKNIFSLLIACFFFLNASAQLVSMDEMYLDEGILMYEKEMYAEAVSKLLKAHRETPGDEEALYYLGLSYSFLGNQYKAAVYFEKLKAIEPNYEVWFYYVLGETYLELGDFEKAQKSFKSFVDKYEEDDIYLSRGECKLRYAIESPVVRKEATSDLPPPVSLGEVVNSKWSDYMPSTNPTGRRIYFTSTRKGGLQVELDEDDEGDEDLYYTDKVGGEWKAPVLLSAPLNSRDNEGASAVSADGQMMVMTACNRADGYGSCDLYIAYLNGDEWSFPQNMGNNVNSSSWDSQPTISSDGKKIYFTSNRPGGYGEEDLYVVELKNPEEWGAPKNLGPTINTPFTDMSPFISPDRATLYFASTGHPGFGDFDLFKSTLKNDSWTVPVNLGTPVNTEAEDLYFTIGGAGEVAYMSSSRNGVMDLFEVKIPKRAQPDPTVIVSGIVTNSKTNNPLGAIVLVEDLTTGELIATSKSNSKTGKYLVVLPAGKNYSVSVAQEGFLFYSNSFDIPLGAEYKEITKNISLNPIEKGVRIVLNNIFFETAKAELKSESFIELDKAVELLKKNPNMKIEIGGHTDNVGTGDANVKLSHDRAAAVVNYIIQHGIETNRLAVKGYGEAQPIATNETEEGRSLNRRVEFLIKEI